jgi:hypothetical protein
VTRLEIEEAEDQRAGKTEHRAREGRTHALEWTGEAFLQLVKQERVLSGIGVERADG